MNPRKRARRILLALPAIAFASLILILSSRPGTDLPSTGIAQGDKGLHIVEYFVFGLLLLLPIRDFGWRGRVPAVVIGIVFAAIDESFQTIVPGRFGDVQDFAADAVGVLAALVLDLAADIARAGKGS